MKNIFSELNRQNSFAEIMRLSEITSEEKLQQAKANSFDAGFTAAEWSKRFPNVPPERIVCQKIILLPAPLYYWDKGGCVRFPLQIYGGQILYPSDVSDQEYEKLLLEQIQRIESYREEKQYLKMFSGISSEGSGKMAMAVASDLLKREEPSAELYKAFFDVYSFTDCGASALVGTDALERLTACKSPEQKEETAKRLSELPEEIEIYRGEGSESTDYQNALSWTTNLDKAYFFAAWRGGEKARIIHAKVRKSDVLEYITDRREAEIIVSPDKIPSESITEKSCITWDDFFEVVTKLPDESSSYLGIEFDDFDASLVVYDVKDTYSYLGRDEDSDHDIPHSVRVALMTSYMFRTEVMPRYKDSTYLVKETIYSLYHALMMAAIWHDTGRVDDSASETHGEASYRLFAEENDEDPVVKFLVEYHCKDDDEARNFWRENFEQNSGYSDLEKSLIWEIFCYMKDADALDRWRFGNLSDDFVQVQYLRTEVAKQLMPVAASLQKLKI